MRPRFLITIDTEGDDLWARHGDITTRNTAYLPRFQNLCERFGFKPTWLTNYEMAMDPAYVEFGRDVIARKCGEIGMHLHAWNSPPLVPLTEDDMRYLPYLVEYPESVMRDKISFLTELLEERFSAKMLSHRAGRWAFDERYARILIDLGYVADCSVTPGVSWRGNRGSPEGNGGSDYRHFPSEPYFLDSEDISRPGTSALLEMPMTIRLSRLAAFMPAVYSIPVLRRMARRIAPKVRWLRPDGRNLSDMLQLVRQAACGDGSYLEFMLHSSELMPGGSPIFRTEANVEKLYEDLEGLFSVVATSFDGETLGGFAQRYQRICGRGP